MPALPQRARDALLPPGQREAVRETDSEYLLYVAPSPTVSGRPAKFDVRLTDGGRGVAGFRRHGPRALAVAEHLLGGFRREYTIPGDVQLEAITARQGEDGVLEVRLPKASPANGAFDARDAARSGTAASGASGGRGGHAARGGLREEPRREEPQLGARKQLRSPPREGVDEKPQPQRRYHAVRPFHERAADAQRRARDAGRGQPWWERRYRPHDAADAAAHAEAADASPTLRTSTQHEPHVHTPRAPREDSAEAHGATEQPVVAAAPPTRSAGEAADDELLAFEADPDIELVLDVQYDDAVAKDDDAAAGFYDNRGEWQEY